MSSFFPCFSSVLWLTVSCPTLCSHLVQPQGGPPPLRNHLDIGTQGAMALAPLAWAVISPRGYLKWRTWTIVAARLAVYLPQSSRRLSTTPIALERPTDPQRLGVLVDGWRLMLGEPACLPACPPASSKELWS